MAPQTSPLSEQEDLWVFGFGSIIWKHDQLEHTSRHDGYICGYTRRFWQLSGDHRGTPQHPGLVVGIYAPQDIPPVAHSRKQQQKQRQQHWRVDGTVFRVQGSKQLRQTVFDRLIARETGYDPIYVPVYSRVDDSVIVSRALTFRATPQLLAESLDALDGRLDDDEAIAAQIASCAGHMGTNAEYAVNLHKALSNMGVDDPHVQAVVDALFASHPNACRNLSKS